MTGGTQLFNGNINQFQQVIPAYAAHRLKHSALIICMCLAIFLSFSSKILAQENQFQERTFTKQEQIELLLVLHNFLIAFRDEDSVKIAEFVPPRWYEIMAERRNAEIFDMQLLMDITWSRNFRETPVLGVKIEEGIIKTGDGRDGLRFASLGAVIEFDIDGTPMMTGFPLWAVFDDGQWYIFRSSSRTQNESLADAYPDVTGLYYNWEDE